MDEPLSLIGIIPILFIFQQLCLSRPWFELCYELLDDAIKIKLSCGIVP